MFEEAEWDVALRPNPVGPGLLERSGPCEAEEAEYDDGNELDEAEDEGTVSAPTWAVRADAKRRSGEEDEEDFEDDEFEEDEDLDDDVDEDVAEDEDV